MRRFTDETGPLGHYSTRRIRLRPVDHDGRMEPSLSTEFRLAVPKMLVGSAYGCGSAPASDRLSRGEGRFVAG